MDINDCIYQRRSIRFYKSEVPSQALIMKILETSIWAPSGKNLQPWKLKILRDHETIKIISDLCEQSRFVGKAPCSIIIFLDKNKSYNYIKDIQACGMLMQNIMLTAFSEGLGTCLIGELIEKGEEVKNILNLTDGALELMGVITIGYPRVNTQMASRKSLSEFLL